MQFQLRKVTKFTRFLARFIDTLQSTEHTKKNIIRPITVATNNYNLGTQAFAENH